jgi:hypothetical protein
MDRDRPGGGRAVVALIRFGDELLAVGTGLELVGAGQRVRVQGHRHGYARAIAFTGGQGRLDDLDALEVLLGVAARRDRYEIERGRIVALRRHLGRGRALVGHDNRETEVVSGKRVGGRGTDGCHDQVRQVYGERYPR